ncbi:MAG: hypothetical protein KGI50_05595 [Patescibacteria group bacterium]|nr:hypothetical protein [Patescibacteria group bacterium]MDE2438895.1 hypothetical protein [Patescibacteria group bacterium]
MSDVVVKNNIITVTLPDGRIFNFPIPVLELNIFWKYAKLIRKNDPAAYPYKFRLVKTLTPKRDEDFTHSDCNLYTEGEKKYFLIRLALDVNNSTTLLIDSLLHEVAHVRTWTHMQDMPHNEAWHTDAFWLEYGRLRRVYWKEM